MLLMLPLINFKFAFENLTNSNATLDAGTAVSYTWFTFIRLGDT